MIWLASLDPANFSMNLDLSGIFGDMDDIDPMVSLLLNCAVGDNRYFLEQLNLIKEDSVKADCVYLASIIWHEQRHFLDLLLTNYGGYLFRQFETCYINTPGIISYILHKKQGKSITFPLSLYLDDVRKSISGEENLSDDICKVINDLILREKAIASERQIIGDFKGVGGYAQIESLGTIFQTAAVENLTPYFASTIRKRMLASDPKGQKYNWPLRFADSLKLPLVKREEGELYHVGMLPMLYYACLNTRTNNKDISDAKKYSLPNDKFLLPTDRFTIILEYLSNKESNFWKIGFDEAWEKMNKIAALLFGRSIVDEIKVNIQFQEDNLDRIRNIDEQVFEFSSNYLDIRKKLCRILQDEPHKILHPDYYCRETLGRIIPIPVLTFSQGIQDDNMSSSWERLHGVTFQYDGYQPVEMSWTAVPRNWDSSNLISFPITLNWKGMVTALTPLAKAMLKGRNHRTMIGPEFLTMESEFNQIDVKINYESDFEYPSKLVFPAKPYYDIRSKTSAICDTCGTNLKKPNGYVLSPWVFRQNEQVSSIHLAALGGGMEAEIKQFTDWSPWLLCQNCLDIFISEGFIDSIENKV